MMSIGWKILSIFIILHNANANDGTNSELSGLYMTAFTPLDKNGNLNLTVVPSYADFIEKSGIRKVLIQGLIIGESHLLTLAERKRLLDAWVSEARLRCFELIVEVEAQNFQDSLELARFAGTRKVSAMTVMSSPYYPPGSVPELVDAMQLLARQAPNTPMIYFDRSYNKPNLAPEDIFDEATKRISNFVGLNCEMNTALAIIGNDLLNENQTLFVNGEYQIASFFEMALNGTISIVAGIFPDLTKDVVNAAIQGDLEKARTQQMRLNQLFRACLFDENYLSTTSISSMKACMSMVTGVEVGPVRAPLPRTGPNRRKTIARRLRNYNVEVKHE